MKSLLSFALLLLVATSVTAQTVLPNRPSGVLMSSMVMSTRFGPWHDLVLSAPTPVFPSGSVRGFSGRGLFALNLYLYTGAVSEVRIVNSTGHQALDDAAVATFHKWVFRPWTIYKAVVPLEFDGSGRVWIGADPREGPIISSTLATVSRHKRGR
jgi:hypothetical protein